MSLFSDFPTPHHPDGWLENAFVQMGQPADMAAQRQQTDDLEPHHDGHGVERELQFDDLGARETQAMG